MTPEQLATERARFREAFKSRYVIHEDDEDNGEDYENCKFEVQLFWTGWLAAKQDSEQQRKELQERINHDPKY